jgi:aminoglycoside phosphotransferase (APT) family kinase protein
MPLADLRIQPLVDLDLAQLRDMVAPVAAGAPLREVIPLDGGLINTVYQVSLAGGREMVVRVYAVATPDEIQAECRLLADLAGELPVPRVVWADPEGVHFGHRYVVYRWMNGITLNEYRRGASPDELALLGAPLGSLLSRIASHDHADLSAPRSVDAAVDEARDSLRAGLARERMGGELADLLGDLLAQRAVELSLLDEDRSMVHGDFSGRNLLVAPGEGRPWRVTGVLDWDSVARGSGLWDVGSLFRYGHRYSPAFQHAFEAGYREAGGVLPDDWWLTSRLVDSTRVVGILDEPRPLPKLFAECRLLITALLTDFGLID